MADELLFHVRVRPVRNGIALVTVDGEIDIATVSSLRATLSPLVSDPTVRVLVADLCKVTFLSCIGVSLLLETRAALLTRDARLRVVTSSNIVLRPLAILGLLETLEVSYDVWSAMD